MTTPSWLAARNGLPADTNAVDKSAQINQFLGTHGVTPIYTGAAVLAPNGTGAGGPDLSNYWAFHTDVFDYDQPFTMSGTVVGRVTLPMLPVGVGADLLVSLCADSAGNPGTVLAQARVPASWFTALAGAQASLGPSTQTLMTPVSGPLQVPQFTSLQVGGSSSISWASPSSSGSVVAGNPASIVAGNFFIQVGGSGVSGNPVANVFTIPFGGGTTLSPAVPQPPLPQAANGIAVAATPDTLVCAGGFPSASAWTANVYTAGWNPNTGQIGAWSQQAALPQQLALASAAAYGETVYVVGGLNNSNAVVSNVYYATIQNGQIQSWNNGPSLPVAVRDPITAVVGNLLIVVGGMNAAVTVASSAVYYTNIKADGSLGPWQSGPSMPVGVGNVGATRAVTSAGLAIVGGLGSGSVYSSVIQTLSVGASGLGAWQQQQNSLGGSGDTGIFPIGPGVWQAFVVYAAVYFTAPVVLVPRISVPLPATGLTNGATYHVLLQQQGGDLNNYLRTHVDSNVFPGNPTALYRARGTSPWTSYFGGYAIPIGLFDQTTGGQILHTWEDAGARITTLVNATTPDVRLLGLAEATQFADGTVTADAAAINYPGTWPAGAWPPLGVTQL